MAYAERVPSPNGNYWRGRFRDPEGRYITVRDEHDQVIRFKTKREAAKAAGAAEADVGAGRWRDPAAGRITFAEWAGTWYAGLDLAPSTMANIKRHLQYHLLPAFGVQALGDIDAAAIAKWEREEKKPEYGYKPASIRSWRGTLHTCLEDAVGKHIGANPATVRRGRGKRSGRRSGDRAAEKVITTPLGVLLIAERMSILSGRDDEFVMVQTAFWDALRIGELVGLEAQYARVKTLRVEWQLYELSDRDPETGEPGGRLLRCPPKDDSRGNVDQPPFLRDLLAGQTARVKPGPCPCHGHPYVFRGMGSPRRGGTVPLRVIAAMARTSETAVAAVISGKGGTRIGTETRERIEEAVAATGYRPVPAADGPAWHWRRSSFEDLFRAAASGQLPPRDGRPERPVPLRGDWPGERVRGRNSQGRADFCWTPVATGLTPHGLRHSMKTWMEENRIPEILSEERLRHDIPGISGVYRHVTPAMRAELVAVMTSAWEGALDARLAMSAGSTVAVVDGLLRGRLEARRPRVVPRDSPESSEAVLPLEGRTASDLRRGGRI